MGKIGRLFVIGGNICAGKSTVVKELGYAEFMEPSAADNEWLSDFYSNPKKYAEVMQFYILKRRFKALVAALLIVLSGEDVYLDRAVWDDSVFVRKNFLDGGFSQEALDDYYEMRRFLIEELQFPSAFIYLDVGVDECLRRNRELRQNACESGLTADYLQGLEDGYEVIKEEACSKNIPWITLDWNGFGSLEAIKQSVTNIENYTQDATWISKVTDDNWVKEVELKLDEFYDSAKERILEMTEQTKNSDRKNSEPQIVATCH